MKRTIICKTISLVLIPAMLLSVASCGKKSGKKTRKIAAEDPWFDAKTYNIEPDLDTGGKDIDFKTQKLAGADDDYIVVFTQGNYIRPTSGEEYNETDYSFYLATVIDRKTGSKINTIDLDQYLSESGYIMDVKYLSGKITSTVYTFDGFTGGRIEVDSDVLTGKKLGERNLGNSFDDWGEKGLIRTGKYTILTSSAFESGSSETYFSLDIYTSAGKECSVKLQKERKDLNSTSVILPIDEDKLLVPFTQTSDNIPVFFEVDVKAAKAVEVDAKDYDWIDLKKIRNVFSGTDGQVYFSTPAGISKIDMKNKKIEEYFNYNACPMNKNLLTSSSIIDCSDSSIVLLGESYSYSLENVSTTAFDIYEITKASVNPNAGKTVLELYSTYGVDEIISEAINRFNTSNADYFIEVTDRYATDQVKTYMSTDTQDDVVSENLQSNMALNDKLAMDIMNGGGPDILINTGDMGRLYNANYLVDLSKYFGTLDSSKYFTNIIDAARTDGKLYQLPVRFNIEGIHTDSKYAGASGVGFTTKEYEDFLYGPLNGYDLSQVGQAYYFTNLFNAMSEKFIVNGKADFSSPEFAELADFVKNNVREKAPTMESEDTDERGMQNDKIARLTSYSLITFYLDGVNELRGADTILGIPSADGRGPQARCQLSVAVSTQAVDIDVCAEFAKLLLSDEIQYDMAKTGYFTLSREAYQKAGSIILDYINGPKAAQAFSMNFMPGEQNNNRIKFTEDDLNKLEKIISSCSHFDSADASINMILIEEMPAYFLGQKDLDSVIRIAQDRAQKVLDER